MNSGIESRAVELRQQGRSYREISTELGIPVGTLTSHFSKARSPEEADKLHLARMQTSKRRAQTQALRVADRLIDLAEQSHRDPSKADANSKLAEALTEAVQLKLLVLGLDRPERAAKTPRRNDRPSPPSLAEVAFKWPPTAGALSE